VDHPLQKLELFCSCFLQLILHYDVRSNICKMTPQISSSMLTKKGERPSSFSDHFPFSSSLMTDNQLLCFHANQNKKLQFMGIMRTSH
ncbi:hypothetical protein KI387_028636, partial [Taxus chinensis]